MDIHPEIDDYIRKSIDHAIGLPVDIQTLESKLRAAEGALMRYRGQYLSLRLRMKEKDEVVERTRAEASMNAQAIKKFVEENQKLSEECSNLASQCAKWKEEISLYDRDRGALMEFGNEAEERAKDAESRVKELEEELGKVLNELERIKARDADEVGLSNVNTEDEEKLLVSVMEPFLCKDGSSVQAFLEANIKHESFNKLHEMWNQLRPSTQMTISLLAEMKKPEKENEHLRINLYKAENEIRLFSEENNILYEESRRLLKKLLKSASGGKQSCSGTTKGNKQKSSSRISSPIDKLDFSETELGRCPLSPLLHNSLDTKNAQD